MRENAASIVKMEFLPVVDNKSAPAVAVGEGAEVEGSVDGLAVGLEGTEVGSGVGEGEGRRVGFVVGRLLGIAVGMMLGLGLGAMVGPGRKQNSEKRPWEAAHVFSERVSATPLSLQSSTVCKTTA